MCSNLVSLLKQDRIKFDRIGQGDNIDQGRIRYDKSVLPISMSTSMSIYSLSCLQFKVTNPLGGGCIIFICILFRRESEQYHLKY